MASTLILSSGHQTWLDTSDIESIVQRSRTAKRVARGIMQDQYQTDTADGEGVYGPLTIVANHYSRDHELLESARQRRKVKE